MPAQNDKPTQPFERGLPKVALTTEPIKDLNQTGKQLVERKADYAGPTGSQSSQSPFAGT